MGHAIIKEKKNKKGKSFLLWSTSAGQDSFQGGTGKARASCLKAAATQLLRELLGLSGSSEILFWP